MRPDANALQWIADQTGKLGDDDVCRIPGCNKPRGRRRWCRMHYMRWIRHGNPLGHAPTVGLNTNGYRVLTKHGHPLATEDGRIYKHRLVLFSVIGEGTHACHWCEKPVTWGVNLYADHVDDDRVNNTPENLVPSCNGCNITRPKATGSVRRPRTNRLKVTPTDQPTEGKR